MIIHTPGFATRRRRKLKKKTPQPLNSSHAKFTERMAARHAANSAAMFAAMPGTRGHIAKKTGLSMTTVHYYVTLAGPEKLHISHWVTGAAGPPQPVYASGPGKNADRPPPSRNARNVKAWRMRQC